MCWINLDIEQLLKGVRDCVGLAAIVVLLPSEAVIRRVSLLALVPCSMAIETCLLACSVYGMDISVLIFSSVLIRVTASDRMVRIPARARIRI